MNKSSLIISIIMASTSILCSCLDNNDFTLKETIKETTLEKGNQLFICEKGNGEAWVTYDPGKPLHLSESNSAKITTYTGSIDIPKIVIIDHWAYDITGIDKMAFANNNELTSIALPYGVTYLGEGAFCNCVTLNSINIPEGVEIIPKACFGQCKELQTITLPASTKTIERLAFGYCNGLKELHIQATTPPNTAEDAFGEYISKTTLYVPTGSKWLYEEQEIWKQFKTITEE